jgi:H+/Cl- antiporter ClcA
MAIGRQYPGGRSVPDGWSRFPSYGREWSLTGLWLNFILVVGVVGGVVGRVVLTALAHWTHCRRNNQAPQALKTFSPA